MVIGLKKDIVYRQLRQAILSGQYTFGDRLPNELEFAKSLKVGKVTLRSALARLESDGLVVKIANKGTFITARQDVATKKYLAVIPSKATGDESPWHYILPGLEEACQESGATLEKCSIHFLRSMTIDEGVKQLASHNFDGIFYLSNTVKGDEQDYLIIKQLNLPVVLPHAAQSDYCTTGFAVLRVNARQAWSEGLKYLHSCGHRCIATIWHNKKKTMWRGFTYNDYLEFLGELGCDTDGNLVVRCQYDYDEVEAAVIKLMHLESFPTAIFCYSDFFALHVYRALKKLNIKIPDQVAVLGYTGYPGSKFCSPSLSTVDINYHKIGKMAFNTMLKSAEWMAGGNAVPLIYTPYYLEERESTRIRRIETIHALAGS